MTRLPQSATIFFELFRRIEKLMEFQTTVKPVTQPAGYTGFLGLEVRVKLEGG